MEKINTWLLVADAGRARLYSLCKARIFQDQDAKSLQLLGNYTHEDSRKKASELVSDNLGEYGSGTFATPTSLKTHEAEQFAHELLRNLETGRIEKSFRDVIIVAPSAFMGVLNKHMPHELQKLVSRNIEKDYTHHNEHELVKSLVDYL